MLKIEHIGIAIKDIRPSFKIFETLLNKECYKIENVISEGVAAAFFKIGETKIELLQATKQDSPLAKFVEKYGEGVHHIAFAVEDIHAEMKRLKNEGFVLLNEKPKKGADNKLICFLHPKSTNHVLIELCQECPK